MSTSIVIIVAAVVILITALIVIGVFTGGLSIFQSIFNPWAAQTGESALCQSKCQTSCFTTGKQPEKYEIDVEGTSTSCTSLGYPCTCGNCVKSGEPCTALTKCCTGTCPTAADAEKICP